MSIKEQNIWGIHAGQTGDGDSLFLKKNYIGVGWVKMGDLSVIKPDRESFKAKILEIYPEKKPGAIPNNAGQLFRFVYEMKQNDLVIYPSKRDHQVHIGSIEGEYKYDPSIDPSYPNLRKVKWLKNIPRTQFSAGALFEIGSAMSLFMVRNYADEFTAVLESDTSYETIVEDGSVAIVADEIENTTKDFILRRLAQELKGHPLAEFIGHLLNCMGYRTRISEAGPDGGVDIVAHKDELGFEPPIIKVQVKSTVGSVGDPIVSALYGKVGAGEFGLLVTLGTFTSHAITFAKSKSNLRLIDGDELVFLIFQHYDQFDSRYKGFLPLRKVFVPEVIEEEE